MPSPGSSDDLLVDRKVFGVINSEKKILRHETEAEERGGETAGLRMSPSARVAGGKVAVFPTEGVP